MISTGSLSRRSPAEWRWFPSPRDMLPRRQIAESVGLIGYTVGIRGAGANFMLTEPSLNNWQFTCRPLARITLQSGTAGGATIVDGTSAPDSFVFFMRNSQQARPIHLNGETLALNEIAVLPPGKRFVLASRGPHKWVSMCVPLDVFEEFGFSRDHLHSLSTAASRLGTPQTVVSQIVTAIVSAIDLVKGAPISSNACHFWDSERALVAALFAAVGNEAVTHASSPCRNGNLARTISQALEVIRRNDGDDLCAEHLCRKINIPQRSLLRAFHRFFGIGTTRYLKLWKLNEAHFALQASNPEEKTVTEILTTCGVTELGRFAGTYKTLFNESPHETLRKKAASRSGVIRLVNESGPNEKAEKANRELRPHARQRSSQRTSAAIRLCLGQRAPDSQRGYRRTGDVSVPRE